MNESKVDLTDRLRREGRWAEASRLKDTALADFRAKGMKRDEAGDAAWEAMAEAYPPLPAEDVVVDAGRVRGLQDIPESWPELPGNASLQGELRWVTASRLRVCAEEPGGVIRVRLERAERPAPSHGALSWMDMAIRFPSKFAELISRVLKNEEDEREQQRRERLSVEECRRLLAEMLEEEGE